jgi:hypothetical protein
MNDKINVFENYLRDNKIKYFYFESNNNQMSITKSLLTYRTGIDLTLLALVIYFTYTIDQKDFYMIPIIGVWVGLLLLIWSDFKYINKIVVDFDSKQIEVRSRNTFKRVISEYVLNDKGVYTFDEISNFSIDKGLMSSANRDIYVLKMKLKDSTQIILASFSKEEQAVYFSHFFGQVI